VLAFDDRVLVTVRDPGLLLELVEDHGVLREVARTEIANDAWGLAVSADGKTIVVTSAWTHTVTGIDGATLSVRWTRNVAREPRGIAIDHDAAYVSHLVGTPITKISGIDGATPTAVRVELPASPLRATRELAPSASLGYAAVLSPDGAKLFVPREALGAQSKTWFFGLGTVDVLATATLSPVAPARSPSLGGGNWSNQADAFDVEAPIPLRAAPFVQPRAAIYRASTRTLLVASEGTNALAELDARALDPSLAPAHVYSLATRDDVEAPHRRTIRSGGAPTGIALSRDEKTAYVFCRSTYDLVSVDLDAFDPTTPFVATPNPVVHLADDPQGGDVAKGRQIFYDADDDVVSGGVGCAGCHPDGRDDGHTWHELAADEKGEGDEFGYRSAPVIFKFGESSVHGGRARQTPMLAGRVAAAGPYGWIGESPNIETRVRVGFGLHRWMGGTRSAQPALDRPTQLAAFVRAGLVAPAAAPHEPTDEEKRGEALFRDAKTACATCHAPATEFTNRSLAALGRPTLPLFDDEKIVPFKTPSLLFVGGTPPYFHDGAVSSLEALVDRNGKSMGDTTALSEDDRHALAAYLRTIGGYVAPPADDAPLAPPSPADPSAESIGRMPWKGAWKDVPKIDLGVHSPAACTVQREGHWLHLACPKDPFLGVDAVAGGVAEFESWHGKIENEFFGDAPQDVTFALREGQRRVLHLTGVEGAGRWGTTPTTFGILQAEWPAGATEPTVVLR